MSQSRSPAPAPVGPEPSVAGLPLLIRIRWLAVPGQLVVSWLLFRSMATDFSGWWAIPLIVAGSNEVARRLSRQLPASALAGTLIVLDSSLLTWWLWESGGAVNPFTLLYLTLIALAALVLRPVWTYVLAVLASLQFGFLLLARETPAMAGHQGHFGQGPATAALDTHLEGMFFAFLLGAALTALFVSGLRRELDRRESDLARARAERSQAERLAALSSMIGSAAHELSTPVATLALAGEEIGRRVRSDAPRLALELEPELEALREQSARCRKILDGLAERAGEPRGEAFRLFPVAELIEAALGDLPADQRARIRLTGVQDLKVLAPRRALAGAIGALLRNAFDASSPAAEVGIETVEEAGAVELRVLDDGQGIPSDQLERVGEPFFTTKAAGRGLGLGLFMARSLVGHLGGQILLGNRPGGGGMATLRLPLADGAPRDPKP